MISIAVINRFYPPDSAITGTSAQELVNFLRIALPQARIRVYATRARYAGTAALVPTDGGAVTRIASWYDGAAKLPRLLASLVEGFRLALAATHNTDVVISLTDPPLLGLWVGLMRRIRKFRWLEWTMDIYPEAFAAAGLVTSHNLVQSTLSKLMRSSLPDRYIALGPEQYAYLQKLRGAVPAFILPCGISELSAGPAPDWRTAFPAHVVVAYAGNLGEAHSEEILLALVRRADPARFRFLLALRGAKAARTRDALAGATHIIWRDNVAHADLAHADVHVATLKPQWTHVCVPSKAVSSVCLERPILFAGSSESDNWTLLRRAGWLIRESGAGSFAAEDVDAVLEAMASPQELAGKSANALALRQELLALKQQVFREIAGWIEAS